MSRALSTLALAVLICTAVPVYADTITVSGIISQPQDPSNPAVENPNLNNIALGDSYNVTLDFAGSITGPGTPDMTGATLTFTDTTQSPNVTEGAFLSTSLTITQSPGVDTFGLLGCLTSNIPCDQGEQLDLFFTIPSASLNAQNVPAGISFGQKPFELQEDSANTDIMGTVTTYSYTPTGAVPTPEPGTLTLLGSALLGLAARSRRFWTR